MIVTEYVPGGNLKDLLHGNDAPISLDARLRIAIECADALGYMHSSMYQPIIHGDIKPDNILLDNNLSAKLADFGLSRLVCMDQAQYTMNVAGCRCYMDPVFLEYGLVDPKNDVYSFGVVLLELITRAEASNKSRFSTGLKRNFTDALRKGKQEAWKMFDSEIANARNIDILDGIGSLAAECVTKEIRERPQMKDVQECLQVLRRTLHCAQAQEKTDQGLSWGMQDTTEMVDNNGGKSNSSTSSSKSNLRYKLSILDMFNKNARRYRHACQILERYGVNIFTKSYLERITRNHSQIIGMGFTYLGLTEDNNKVVVKKFFNRNDRYDVARVMESASRISHTNIIRLVGCCLETEVPLLVYEFVHSSLWELLHGNNNASTRCPWLKIRLDIAIGSAEALAYLHSVTPTNFVHGNITSRNILLDYDFVPKVQNAVFFPEYVCPKREYMDPLNIGTPGIFTAKSDVFSYGVVLLELITGKRPHKSLPREYIENGGEAMFDKAIAVGGNIPILEEIGKLATQCLSEKVGERPEMVEVVEKLQNLRRDYRKQSRDRGLNRYRSFH
ncbi:hypothetical protein BS78_09G125900 [Paspalum vaginatum]|nr:hypothetical protein BS78_09G125900 [Paspalum vaginatum]